MTEQENRGNGAVTGWINEFDSSGLTTKVFLWQQNYTPLAPVYIESPVSGHIEITVLDFKGAPSGGSLYGEKI